ncbi:MAG TPA: hypothetical protein VLL08_18255 [Kineosporiaceae bacterium]|nr:hypothetical protein [Kineosporiaceae bacterium]
MSRRYLGVGFMILGGVFIGLAFGAHGLGMAGDVPGVFGVLLFVVGAFVAF